jgi:hypothetical protein
VGGARRSRRSADPGKTGSWLITRAREVPDPVGGGMCIALAIAAAMPGSCRAPDHLGSWFLAAALSRLEVLTWQSRVTVCHGRRPGTGLVQPACHLSGVRPGPRAVPVHGRVGVLRPARLPESAPSRAPTDATRGCAVGSGPPRPRLAAVTSRRAA